MKSAIFVYQNPDGNLKTNVLSEVETLTNIGATLRAILKPKAN
jgi:hypothetical protein